jgi:hypothetical protein
MTHKIGKGTKSRWKGGLRCRSQKNGQLHEYNYVRGKLIQGILSVLGLWYSSRSGLL